MIMGGVFVKLFQGLSKLKLLPYVPKLFQMEVKLNELP